MRIYIVTFILILSKLSFSQNSNFSLNYVIPDYSFQGVRFNFNVTNNQNYPDSLNLIYYFGDFFSGPANYLTLDPPVPFLSGETLEIFPEFCFDLPPRNEHISFEIFNSNSNVSSVSVNISGSLDGCENLDQDDFCDECSNFQEIQDVIYPLGLTLEEINNPFSWDLFNIEEIKIYSISGSLIREPLEGIPCLIEYQYKSGGRIFEKRIFTRLN